MNNVSAIDGAGFNKSLQNSAMRGLHGSESFGDLRIFHQGEVSFVSSDGFIQGPKVVKFPKSLYEEFLLKVYDLGEGTVTLVSSDAGSVSVNGKAWIESVFFVRRRLK